MHSFRWGIPPCSFRPPPNAPSSTSILVNGQAAPPENITPGIHDEAVNQVRVYGKIHPTSLSKHYQEHRRHARGPQGETSHARSPPLLGSWRRAACAHKAVIRPNVHHMQSPFNRTKERLFVLRLVRLPIDGSSKVWPLYQAHVAAEWIVTVSRDSNPSFRRLSGRFQTPNSPSFGVDD